MDSSVKLRFFGDFTTGENYQLNYENKTHDSLLRRMGYDFLMSHCKSFLSKDTFNIVNLETPITLQLETSLYNKKPVIHWSDPYIIPEFLKKYNVHAVTLGNNHCYDLETNGLKDTIESLNRVQIPFFGAGLNKEQAAAPFKKTFQIGDKFVNLYVFGGYKYRENYDVEFDFYAKENKAGAHMFTPETTCSTISKIKENDKNAFIVCFPHFGFDLQKTAEHQVEYAKAFMDAGADYVIGHGAHIMQRVDYYKDTPIVYSLGNFVFNAKFNPTKLPYNLISEVELFVEGGEVKFAQKLYPIYANMHDSDIPVTRPIKESELDDVLKFLCEGDSSVRTRITVERGEIICIKL